MLQYGFQMEIDSPHLRPATRPLPRARLPPNSSPLPKNAVPLRYGLSMSLTPPLPCCLSHSSLLPLDHTPPPPVEHPRSLSPSALPRSSPLPRSLCPPKIIPAPSVPLPLPRASPLPRSLCPSQESSKTLFPAPSAPLPQPPPIGLPVVLRRQVREPVLGQVALLEVPVRGGNGMLPVHQPNLGQVVQVALLGETESRGM